MEMHYAIKRESCLKGVPNMFLLNQMPNEKELWNVGKLGVINVLKFAITSKN